MKKFRIFLYILLLLLALFWVAYLAFHQARTVQRDVPSLQNLYYRFKNTDPIKAKESLELILRQAPNHMDTVYALGSWYLEQGDTRGGLNFLQQQEQRHPNDPHIARLLTKFYQVIGQSEMAEFYSKKALSLEDGHALRHVKPEDLAQAHDNTILSFITPIKAEALFDLSPLLKNAIATMLSAPAEARVQLETIVALKPDSEEAYTSLGYLALQAGQKQEAERYFAKAYSLKESNALALQLAYLLIDAKRFDEANRYLEYAFKHGNADARGQVQRIRDYLKNAQEPAAASQIAVVPLSPRIRALNAFYQYKGNATEKALYYINWLLAHFPQDAQIQKEAAYFFVAIHDNDRALELWKTIYARSASPHDALIIAYLLDNMKQPKAAYDYFVRASKSSDPKDNLAANQAMTNLAGIQNRFLPEPYFLEVYGAPFYFSRFDLGVLPYILRLGRVLEERHQTSIYLNNRRTKDNRSGEESFIFPGVISQIFEDNVAIYSVGIRTNPFVEQPLMAFLEVGRAESLVPTNTPVWRDDVRGGFVYFNAWGERPIYAPELEFPFKYVSTLYADTIYYSRYDNNIIGTAWFRPGLRVARYQTASLDLYLANYLILDKNHEFYNNTYILGPGIGFMPNNRYNVIFRLESLQGFYIPVNSPTPNPYKSHYYNNVAMLEFFYRF